VPHLPTKKKVTQFCEVAQCKEPAINKCDCKVYVLNSMKCFEPAMTGCGRRICEIHTKQIYFKGISKAHICKHLLGDKDEFNKQLGTSNCELRYTASDFNQTLIAFMIPCLFIFSVFIYLLTITIINQVDKANED